MLGTAQLASSSAHPAFVRVNDPATCGYKSRQAINSNGCLLSELLEQIVGSAGQQTLTSRINTDVDEFREGSSS